LSDVESLLPPHPISGSTNRPINASRMRLRRNGKKLDGPNGLVSPFCRDQQRPCRSAHRAMERQRNATRPEGRSQNPTGENERRNPSNPAAYHFRTARVPHATQGPRSNEGGRSERVRPAISAAGRVFLIKSDGPGQTDPARPGIQFDGLSEFVTTWPHWGRNDKTDPRSSGSAVVGRGPIPDRNSVAISAPQALVRRLPPPVSAHLCPCPSLVGWRAKTRIGSIHCRNLRRRRART
jgi:hypothetical protein